MASAPLAPPRNPRLSRAVAAGAMAAVMTCGLAASAASPASPPASSGAPAKPTTVRICDEGGCRTEDSSTETVKPAEERQNALSRDSDTYHGENLEQLRDQAAAGDAVAAYKLGIAYAFGLGGATKDIAAAESAWTLAAARGHAWAQFRLAQRLLSDQNPQKDPGKGIQYLLAAADQGHPVASYMLGVAYVEGNDLPQDNGEAYRYFTTAAENGIADAQYNLALMMFRGQGITRNLYEAFGMMKRAANGGNVRAQVALGRIYTTGLDTMPQDLKKAQEWLSTAAGQGDGEAKDLLAQLQEKIRKDEEYRQKMSLLQAQTAAYLMGAVFEALSTPTIAVYSRW